MDCSLPSSPVHGIFKVRILEWVAIPSPGDLPNPGMEPMSPALQLDSLPLRHREATFQYKFHVKFFCCFMCCKELEF